MTIGQNLESLRVQLSSVYRTLHELVLKSPTAPTPSVQSLSYDDYAAKLNSLEQQLKRMEQSFGRLKGQGPGYRGPSEDPYQSKQRDASFRAQVESVEAILKLCFDDLAALVAPDKRGTVKAISNLGKKADELLRLVKMDGKFRSEIAYKGPVFSPADTGTNAPVDFGVSSFVTLGIVVVVGLKKLLSGKNKQQ
jgi:hypothetical protein